jgi:hypothetical protein
LKTDEYGAFILNKSLNRGKWVATFQYKLKMADKIQEFLDATKEAPAKDIFLEEFDLDAIYP